MNPSADYIGAEALLPYQELIFIGAHKLNTFFSLIFGYLKRENWASQLFSFKAIEDEGWHLTKFNVENVNDFAVIKII